MCDPDDDVFHEGLRVLACSAWCLACHHMLSSIVNGEIKAGAQISEY